MCGYATGRLGFKKASIYLGYHGGELNVDGLIYKSTYGSKEEAAMYEHLLGYTKEALIEMIISFVENADEG